MGYIGSKFTWSNKRQGRANIQERLDWGFSNADWKILFLHASISHLMAAQLDHKPLLLSTTKNFPYVPRPF